MRIKYFFEHNVTDIISRIKSDNKSLTPVLILDMKNLKDYTIHGKVIKLMHSISNIRFPVYTVVDNEIVNSLDRDIIKKGKTWDIILTVGYNQKGEPLFSETRLDKILKELSILDNVEILPYTKTSIDFDNGFWD